MVLDRFVKQNEDSIACSLSEIFDQKQNNVFEKIFRYIFFLSQARSQWMKLLDYYKSWLVLYFWDEQVKYHQHFACFIHIYELKAQS